MVVLLAAIFHCGPRLFCILLFFFFLLEWINKIASTGCTLHLIHLRRLSPYITKSYVPGAIETTDEILHLFFFSKSLTQIQQLSQLLLESFMLTAVILTELCGSVNMESFLSLHNHSQNFDGTQNLRTNDVSLIFPQIFWLSELGLRNTPTASLQRSKTYKGLVWFYGISTFVGYLLPNLFLFI